MVKRVELPSSARHVRIYDEDWKWLNDNYGPGSGVGQVGVSNAIRRIVHAKVQAMRGLVNTKLDQQVIAEGLEATREEAKNE